MDTVADLIRALQSLPQDARPFVSSDSEGNSMNRIWCVGVEKSLKGDPEYSALNWDDIDNGEYGDNPEIETFVCIWPV